MKRSSLHPRVHLIAGILISAVSAYALLFTNLENKAPMQLFLYVGLAFIAFAFIKLAIKYIKSGKLREDEERIATKVTGVPSQHQTDQEYQEQLARQSRLHQSSPQIIQCGLCKTRNYATSNYCHMCGYKLR